MSTNINWKEVKTVNGDGSHLPNAIYKLCSSDENERQNAYWQIDNYAIVQSDLYEASYYVIEPIIELLNKNYTVSRLYPLRVLTEIALGGNGQEVIQLQDEFQSKKTIIKACRDKLLSLRSKIEKIDVREDDEIEEKETLLNCMNDW